MWVLFHTLADMVKHQLKNGEWFCMHTVLMEDISPTQLFYPHMITRAAVMTD